MWISPRENRCFLPKISLNPVVVGQVFTKPIAAEVAEYQKDNSFNMTRIEVLSRSGHAH